MPSRFAFIDTSVKRIVSEGLFLEKIATEIKYDSGISMGYVPKYVSRVKTKPRHDASDVYHEKGNLHVYVIARKTQHEGWRMRKRLSNLARRTKNPISLNREYSLERSQFHLQPAFAYSKKIRSEIGEKSKEEGKEEERKKKSPARFFQDSSPDRCHVARQILWIDANFNLRRGTLFRGTASCLEFANPS